MYSLTKLARGANNKKINEKEAAFRGSKNLFVVVAGVYLHPHLLVAFVRNYVPCVHEMLVEKKKEASEEDDSRIFNAAAV